MEKKIKEDQFNVQSVKKKQSVTENVSDSTKTSETPECSRNRSGEKVVKSSNSKSISSSHCDCSAHSFDDYVVKKQTSKKRKLSRDVSIISTKKRRVDSRAKSFEKQKKLLEKKVEKKYSHGGPLGSRKSKHASRRIISNNEEKISKKSRDKSKSKPQEKNFKDEYNKRLDCLAKFGKNFYCPSMKQRSGLRPIYIDGSNVAFSHGQNEKFSVEGLKICIDYFRKRGHEVKAFVPHFRLRRGESTDQDLLHKLVSKKLVITTPTLYIQNQRRSPYDDWYIIQSAAANGGIIVSCDSFQDIIKWNPNLRSVIEECRLVPTFVDDMLIFPVDPHGNRQNNLEQFLRF